MRTGWNAARREIVVAICLIFALTAGTWAVTGAGAAAVVLVGCVAAGLAVLRGLLDHGDEPAPPPAPHADVPTQSFYGFWRTQSELVNAARSLAAWDNGPRVRLVNLLAARLSERHGVSLADDPQTARDLLLSTHAAGRHSAGRQNVSAGRPSRADLWYWVDPHRPTPPDADARPGIPPSALAALIDRLEKL